MPLNVRGATVQQFCSHGGAFPRISCDDACTKMTTPKCKPRSPTAVRYLQNLFFFRGRGFSTPPSPPASRQMCGYSGGEAWPAVKVQSLKITLRTILYRPPRKRKGAFIRGTAFVLELLHRLEILQDFPCLLFLVFFIIWVTPSILHFDVSCNQHPRN